MRYTFASVVLVVAYASGLAEKYEAFLLGGTKANIVGSRSPLQHDSPELQARRGLCCSSRQHTLRHPVVGLHMAARKPTRLTDEEISRMERTTEETNRKLQEFLTAKTTLREEQQKLKAEENRVKTVQRIESEKEKAAEAKVYIPHRLEEIKREEEQLEDRMAEFNAKVNDTDVPQF